MNQQQHETELQAPIIRHEVAEVEPQRSADEGRTTAAERSDAGAVERTRRALEHEVFRRRRQERAGGLWMAAWLLPLVIGFVSGRLGDWVSWMVTRPLIGILY